MLSTYNVFQRKHEPALCCAVRQDQPIPTFVNGEAWKYDRTIADTGAAPAGFQPMAAQESTKLMGFYLFQRVRA